MPGELTAHSTIAHYRIIAKLGAGGMREVYLAQDTKLDRTDNMTLPTDQSGPIHGSTP
jgi:hypothetical protein